MQKHRKIYDDLRAEIATGQFSLSGKLPSESQLVEKYGVSRPTIARALLDLQHEGLIERRAGAGTFLKSRTAPVDAQVLGLLAPGRGSTEVLDLICGEIGALARLRNFGLLWGRSAHPLQDRTLDAQLAEEACQQFIERGVRGVFFCPFEHLDKSEEVNSRLLEMLHQSGIPVVLFDRDLKRFPLRSNYDLIALDNQQAGFLAADHLLKLGCREFRLLSEPGSASSVDARVAGMREAIAQRGFTIPERLRIDGDPTDPAFIGKSIVDRGLEAVICANDFTAARLMKTLAQLEVDVPRDLRLIGFDDARYATLSAVSLTTIHQPFRELAAVVFRTLVDRIHDASLPIRTLLLAPKLVVRDSCGAYPLKDQKARPGR